MWSNLLVFSILFFKISIVFSDNRVLVGYPETQSFYKPFYSALIKDLKKTLLKSDIAQIDFKVIKQTSQVSQFAVNQEQYKGVILLGAIGTQIALLLSKQSTVPVVTAASIITQSKHPALSGVSILTDPKELVNFIHQLLPQHSRVVIVINVDQEQENLNRLKEALRPLHIQLTVLHVQSLQEANAAYQRIIPAMNPKTDILWLTNHPTTMELGTLFPTVLMTAWTHKIPIVSNALSHRGVMIGAFPNPKHYGKQIAELLIQKMKTKNRQTPIIELAKQINVSYNRVYATHLGIDLPNSLKDQITILYE